ncbi:MAG: 4-(cytidine 5'-diphospho)-2-C-methyl-D-erythritol kinase [Clostridia bacterium]|nr:4-(cytidine 5'-diphospho)-2-C-methyl-D-erythritol kinase [Clostridia bacterium]
MRIPAYAKINLYLDVMEKRPDGFHNIKSIMHRVSLCDYVSAERHADEGKIITVSCMDARIPSGEGNLVWKAADRFFKHFSIENYSVSFDIEKHIPVSGGLAGGSTDAAAALVLLNELYGTGASTYELCEIGALVGSDVPFCLVGGSCITLGRGEELEYLPSALKLDLVIAKGGDGVSTPAAYKRIDEMYGDTLSQDFGSLERAVSAVCNSDTVAIADAMYNTFESVVLPVHAEAAFAKSYMEDADGCVGAMLSGSGPSVFGIFNNKESAEAVCADLSAKGYEAHTCESI